MLWLDVFSKEVTPFIIVAQEIVDHEEYIRNVLTIPLKYGKKDLWKHWTFQQDGAKPHVHHLTQNGAGTTFHRSEIKIIEHRIVKI